MVNTHWIIQFSMLNNLVIETVEPLQQLHRTRIVFTLQFVFQNINNQMRQYSIYLV